MGSPPTLYSNIEDAIERDFLPHPALFDEGICEIEIKGGSRAHEADAILKKAQRFLEAPSLTNERILRAWDQLSDLRNVRPM